MILILDMGPAASPVAGAPLPRQRSAKNSGGDPDDRVDLGNGQAVLAAKSTRNVARMPPDRRRELD